VGGGLAGGSVPQLVEGRQAFFFGRRVESLGFFSGWVGGMRKGGGREGDLGDFSADGKGVVSPACWGRG